MVGDFNARTYCLSALASYSPAQMSLVILEEMIILKTSLFYRMKIDLLPITCEPKVILFLINRFTNIRLVIFICKCQ